MIPSNVVQLQGQGQVSSDNLNTFLQVCDIAANLRTFIGRTGMQVSLSGIVSANDGLGGLFYWKTGGGFVDDNLNVIVPNGTINGAWLRQDIFSGILQRNYLTAPLGLYTDGTNGSDSNSGLNANHPLKHLQTALDLLISDYDLGGQGAVIYCTGNYSQGVVQQTPFTGGSPQNVSFFGSGAILNTNGANGFLAVGAGCGFGISGFTVSGSGSGYYSAINCSGGARIMTGVGLVFGANLQAHINVTSGGVVIVNGSYSTSGGANCHWDVDGAGAVLYIQPKTIVSLGSTAYNNFCYCAETGLIQSFNTSFQGNPSAKWGVNVQNNGVVNTAGLMNIPPTDANHHTLNVNQVTGGQYN